MKRECDERCRRRHVAVVPSAEQDQPAARGHNGRVRARARAAARARTARCGSPRRASSAPRAARQQAERQDSVAATAADVPLALPLVVMKMGRASAVPLLVMKSAACRLPSLGIERRRRRRRLCCGGRRFAVPTLPTNAAGGRHACLARGTRWRSGCTCRVQVGHAAHPGWTRRRRCTISQPLATLGLRSLATFGYCPRSFCSSALIFRQVRYTTFNYAFNPSHNPANRLLRRHSTWGCQFHHAAFS